jgi:tRNA G46 methylase TrmB
MKRPHETPLESSENNPQPNARCDRPVTPPAPTRRSTFAARLRAMPDGAYAEERAFGQRGRWREVFGDRIGSAFDGRIELEIGCFDAGFLSTIAAKFPRTAFVGLDWKCKAIYEGARRIASLGLKNVLLLHGRAQDLRSMFDDREISEIWVFHPDPFDTESELKNRLMSASFLRDAHALLADGRSTLSLKTDHAGYYQWTLDLFGLHPSAAAQQCVQEPRAGEASPGDEGLHQLFDVTARSADYWNDPTALAATAGRAFAGEMTLFEQRFVSRKQPIHYFQITKRPPLSIAATIEP